MFRKSDSRSGPLGVHIFSYAPPPRHTTSLTRDGRWVSISGGPDGIFANNCKAIGRSDLTTDPRFRMMKDRAQNADLLNTIFNDWIVQHTLEQCLDAFVSAQAVLVPVYSVDQIFQDPQLREREAIVSVPDEDFGEVRMQGVVPKFSRGSSPVRISGGAMGVDNARVYSELLGLSEQDLARLRDLQVI